MSGGGFVDNPLGGYSDDGTSRDAAQSQFVGGKIADDHRAVFDHITACGDEGSTDDEGYMKTGLVEYTYKPRRTELTKVGLIKKSGRRRKTQRNAGANVYVATGLEFFKPEKAAKVPVEAVAVHDRIEQLEGLLAKAYERIASLESGRTLRSGADTNGQGSLL